MSNNIKIYLLLFFFISNFLLALDSNDTPLLFGRYTKFSIGIGEKKIYDIRDPVLSKGPVINIELEHFLDSLQNWSLNLNYFYMNIENNEFNEITEKVIIHFPTLTLKYYLLNIDDNFRVNLHFGSYLTFVLLTWDIGGGLSYNIFNQKLFIESSIHYTNKFPLILPGIRMPLIYKINFSYKF